MKTRLSILFLIFSSFIFSQNISTGLQTLKDDLSVNIEVSNTTTTLTIEAPDDVWFAVGFDEGAFDMFSNSDVFRTDGTTIIDAQTNGLVLPPQDASQDWVLESNTTNEGIRTIVATRDNDTGDTSDFVFNNTANSIDLIWAFGTTTNYGYHGGENRGATILEFSETLATSDFENLDFDIFPNPALDILTLQLGVGLNDAIATIYDFSGRRVKNQEITSMENKVNIENLISGVYLLKIATANKLGIKKIIKK